MGIRVETLFFAVDRQPPLPHEYQFKLDDHAGQLARHRSLGLVRGARNPSPEETATGK